MKAIKLSLMALVVAGAVNQANAQDTQKVEEKVYQTKHVKVVLRSKNAQGTSDTTEVVTYKVKENGDTVKVIKRKIYEEKTLTDDDLENVLEDALEAAFESIEEANEEIEEASEAIERAGEEIERVEEDIEEEVELSFRLGEGSDDDDDHNGASNVKWNIFEFGLNNFIDASNNIGTPSDYPGLELQNGKSYNLHWRIINQRISFAANYLSIEYGLGVEFQNFRFKNNIDLFSDSLGLDYVENPDREYTKNKLVTQYVTAPLMLNIHPFGNEELTLGGGVIVGYRFGSHQKLKWQDERQQKLKVRDDFELEDLKIGYNMQLSYNDFRLFARYYPNAMFKKDKGPQVGSVSAGIGFFGF